MKPKLAIILVAVLAFTGSASAQWSTITFDESNPLTGVAFVSDSRGVVVGSNEFIYETRNGGSIFSRITVIGLDATKCCHSIRFLDGNIGWIGGDLAVLRTTNSGTTFGGTQIVGSTSARSSIFGVSDTVAWQVTANSYHRYTLSIGGGQVSTSSGSVSAGSGTLRDLWLFTPDTGILVGDNGRIVRLTNGSATPAQPAFAVIPSPTGESLRAIHMVNASVGWIVGTRGTILKIENGGSSWTAQSSGTVNNLYGVHFRNGSIGWAVGDAGLILVTVSGGSSWAPEPSGTSNDLRGVFAAPNNAFAVGVRGTVLKRAALSIVVGGISPDRGPTAGGTAVTISGAGFKSGATVKFGGVSASSVVLVNAGTITAVTPLRGSGSVDVVVTNTDNTTATLARGFLFVSPPRRRGVRR